MQLGASVWGFFHQQDMKTWPTLAGAVDDIRSLDAALGVEIWGSRALDQPMVEGRDLVDLVDACYNAAFVTVHVQGQHWSWDPAALRREIDFAHQLGAGKLILHPACFDLVVEDDRPDWPEILRIAEYAAKFGVKLAMENIKDSIWMLDRILDEVGDDPETSNLGICIDMGHANQSDDAGRHPVTNYLERYAGQLCHLHLHDNHGENDDHFVPGVGTVDWAQVQEVLTKMGFSGTAVLEVRDPSMTPKEFLKQSLGFLARSGF